MRKSIEITLPIAIITTAIFLTGAAIGTGVSIYFYHKKIVSTTGMNRTLLASNKNLQNLMARMSLAQEASLEVPAPAGQPQPVQATATSAQAAPTVAQSVSIAKPIIPPAVQPPRQAKPVANTPSIQRNGLTTSVVSSTPAASMTTPTPSQTTTAQQVAPQPATPAAASTPSSPAISMEQAGISGIDTSGIQFKSGRRVLVGELFPSGEKLISSLPGEGKIVTDRRTILLAKPTN
jgi:hypothetical protein